MVATIESVLRAPATEIVVVAASNTMSISRAEVFAAGTGGYMIREWIPGDHTSKAITIRAISNTSLDSSWPYRSYFGAARAKLPAFRLSAKCQENRKGVQQ